MLKEPHRNRQVAKPGRLRWLLHLPTGRAATAPHLRPSDGGSRLEALHPRYSGARKVGRPDLIPASSWRAPLIGPLDTKLCFLHHVLSQTPASCRRFYFLIRLHLSPVLLRRLPLKPKIEGRIWPFWTPGQYLARISSINSRLVSAPLPSFSAPARIISTISNVEGVPAGRGVFFFFPDLPLSGGLPVKRSRLRMKLPSSSASFWSLAISSRSRLWRLFKSVGSMDTRLMVGT